MDDFKPEVKRLDCFGCLFLQDSKETYNVGHVGNKAGMEPSCSLHSGCRGNGFDSLSKCAEGLLSRS